MQKGKKDKENINNIRRNKEDQTRIGYRRCVFKVTTFYIQLSSTQIHSKN